MLKELDLGLNLSQPRWHLSGGKVVGEVGFGDWEMSISSLARFLELVSVDIVTTGIGGTSIGGSTNS